MTNDCLIIDIETKNTFADVGGQDKLLDLEMSLVGVYSYNDDKFFTLREGSFHELSERLRHAKCIVGFSSKRFDIPIMNKYFDFDVLSIPNIDLLEEVERRAGHRISLDLLAKENLGVGKTGHGLDAIKYYNAGDWKSLEEYCLQDVKVTRDLYDFVMEKKHLVVPQKWGAPRKIEMFLTEPEPRQKPQTVQNKLF